MKATGKQWFWTYSYPDHGKFEFDSLMVRDAPSCRPDQPRLLGVDNEMVVPVNKNVRVITTGAEVIHAFAVPSFGIKIDAIPGRLNETWFKATREGIYYGQCSELCGKDHAFMPIAVRVVSEEAFKAWVEEAQEEIRARRRDADHGRGGGATDRPLSGAHRARSAAATTEVEGTDNGYDRTLPRRARRPRCARRMTRSRHADRLAALRLFDQPQGHRHDVPGVRAGRRRGRRHPVDRHAARAAWSRACRSSTTRTCSTCSPPRTA